MKNTLALTAIVATVGLANAGNLRAEPAKTLLQKCTGKDVKPDACCSSNRAATHELYKKGRKINNMPFQCCSKSMGMWMPTSNKKYKDQFCSLGLEASLAKTSMANVNSLTDKMVNVLDRLNDEKHQLKADFRAAYIAHESVESKSKDEAKSLEVKQKKEVQYLADEQTKTSNELTKAIDTLNDNKEAQEQMQAQFERDINAIKKQIEASEKATKELEAAQDKESRKLKDVQAKLSGCNSDKKELKELQDKLKKDLEVAEAAKKAALEKQAALIKQNAEAVKALEQATKELADKKKELEEKSSKLTKVIEVTKESIEDTKKAISKYEAMAFIEVKINPAACDDKCKQFRTWDSSKYIAGDEKMMDDAKKYVNSEIENLHTVLKEIKAVRVRVTELKGLDEDLHAKIMKDVFKKNKALETAIKTAQKELQKTLDQLESVEATNKEVVEKTAIMQRANIEALNGKKLILATKQKAEDNLQKALDDLKVTISVNSDLFKECKKDKSVLDGLVKSLEQDSQAASEKAAQLESSANEMKDSFAKGQRKIEEYNNELDRENNELDANVNSLKDKALKLMDEDEQLSAKKKKAQMKAIGF
jgi:chromosome segregation ATPase